MRMTAASGVTGAVIGLLDSLWHRSAGPQCTGQKRRAGAQGRRCNTRELPVCLCLCLCVCVCVCVQSGLVLSSAVCVCVRSEEHTSALQSHLNLVCRLLLEQK